MSDSIRQQLLGMGFKPAPKPERKPQPAESARKPAPGKSSAAANRAGKSRPDGRARTGAGGKPSSQEDIDLAKAYAIRAQREKDERMAEEAARQEAARLRRQAKADFDEFIKDKALNLADADIARHFEYGGKIKRVYVSADQLKALNAGQLGVVQQNGRYLLVSAQVLEQAAAIFAQAVALKVDPDAPAADDPYADPKYQIPDDLVW